MSHTFTIHCPKLFTGAKLFCIVVLFNATKILIECLAGIYFYTICALDTIKNLMLCLIFIVYTGVCAPFDFFSSFSAFASMSWSNFFSGVPLVSNGFESCTIAFDSPFSTFSKASFSSSSPSPPFAALFFQALRNDWFW